MRKHLVSLLAISFLLPQIAASMNLVPSSINGIKVYAPGSKEFEQHVLLKTNGIQPNDWLKRLLNRSLLVENLTGHGIRCVTVRVEGKNKLGRPIARLEHYQNLGVNAKPAVSSGARIVMSMHPSVTTAFSARSVNPAWLNDLEQSSELAMFDGFTDIHTSIDSIILESWEFVGPDLAGRYDRLQSIAKAESDFVSDLSVSMGATGLNGVRKLLAEAAAHTKFNHPFGPFEARDIRSRHAQKLLNALDQGGAEAYNARFADLRLSLNHIGIWRKGKSNVQ